MNEYARGTEVFFEILPQVERHATFAFRYLQDPGHFDDCVQETRALCWKWCCRLYEQGKDARQFPTTLAAFAVRHVKSGRSFVGKKTYRSDVLSPLAQAVQGFRTQALPDGEGQAGPSWMAALADNTLSPVAEQAAFRIDFPAWLETLSQRERTIAGDLAQGETTQELSRRHGLSPGRISQLRRELRDDWTAFTGEEE